MSKFGQYGEYYQCIQLADGNEVFVHGDETEFKDGAIIVWRVKEDGTRFVNVAFSAGQWTGTFAASLMDGHPVAVEHWAKKENQQ